MKPLHNWMIGQYSRPAIYIKATTLRAHPGTVAKE